MRRISLLALLGLIVPLSPHASRAAGECIQKPDVAVAVSVRYHVVGTPGSGCVASFTCFAASCVWTMKVEIKGDGIVGAQVTGAFNPARCGPAALGCEAETAAFTTPYGTYTAECDAAQTAATSIDLGCIPNLIQG